MRIALAGCLLFCTGCGFFDKFARTPLDTAWWTGGTGWNDTADDGPDTTEWIDPSWPTIVINEFVTDNRLGATDGTGAHADWIELFNPNPEDVDLTSWSISDDHGEPFTHRLEQISIPAWGRVLLWADGLPSLGPDHLSFSLEREGGEIGLYAPNGQPIDGVHYGQQATDHAAARVLDGDAEWIISAEPSPGAWNGGTGSGWGGAWPEPPAPCGLVSDLEQVNLLEGDYVSFEAGCLGDLGGAAVLELVAPPDRSSWDGRRFSWQTGHADGGRIDLVFQVTTEGASGELPSAETVTFWVADDPSAEDNVAVEPTAYIEEWGLPVLHVHPWSEIGQGYVAAEITFDGTRYPSQIKVRGATSSYYPKPGYTIEFSEAELDLPTWGVTRDHLVLVSPFDDNAYVRQKLIYDQWAAIAEFWGEPRLAPRSFFVVLYIEGEYVGLFMALDRVDNEFLEHMGFARDAGLYKAVNHDANFFLTASGGGEKDTLHDGYEKKEGDPEDDYGELDELVSFTGGAADAAALLAGDGAWFELGEFMDWFLLVHYSHAEDSAGKNAYLMFEPGQQACRYAPWDFNHAWGQDWRTRREDSGSLNTYTGHNRVFWAMQDDPDAEAALWERFAALAQAGGPFDPEWILATVDGYYELIEPSAARDWERWGADYSSYSGWSGYRDEEDDWTDYEGEKAYLYQWLDERAALFAERR